MSEPAYFEDLAVGQSWESPARTVTETDIVNFACQTGDFDPLHVDHEFARNTPFGRPIAHGLLGLSWVAGLSSQCPRAATLAFAAIREWKFLKPVFVGDTLHVVNEVVDRQAKGRRAGQVVWRRRLVNQAGVVVQEGVFETLVAVRATAERSAA
jgi:acyl dehydratase